MYVIKSLAWTIPNISCDMKVCTWECAHVDKHSPSTVMLQASEYFYAPDQHAQSYLRCAVVMLHSAYTTVVVSIATFGWACRSWLFETKRSGEYRRYFLKLHQSRDVCVCAPTFFWLNPLATRHTNAESNYSPISADLWPILPAPDAAFEVLRSAHHHAV